jgi:hypothetical protein
VCTAHCYTNDLPCCSTNSKNIQKSPRLANLAENSPRERQAGCAPRNRPASYPRPNGGSQVREKAPKEGEGPQFFNPGRVQTARDLLAAKKAEEARIEQEKAEKRIQQAVKKAQKEQEEKERAEAAAIQKAATAEARAQKAAEIQLRKEAREAARRDKAQKPRPRKVPTKATKARAPPRTSQGGDGEVAVAEEVEEAITSSTRTRAVRRPARFAQ